jgi:hypothetical protein
MAGGGGEAGGAAGEAGGGGSPSAYCEGQGLTARAFAAGPHGKRRGELAGDFTLPLADGSPWNFQTSFSGCESYLFLPDTLVVSQQNPTSLWASDLAMLLKRSPKNVHYFFVSRSSEAKAAENIAAMSQRVEGELGKLNAEQAAHWRERLHVVQERAAALGNWVGEVLQGHGALGFGIDRMQRVRGVGNFADVDRFKAELQAAEQWPWEGNLAYAAHEARYFNAQVELQDALDKEEATEVPIFQGEILEQFAEQEVQLPGAAEMAGFDTLQIEIAMACPDPDKIEFNNCGPWDYLAILGVEDGGTLREVARFITSYHRETRWVVDASPMLALLKGGGLRKFRWDFAPEWNKQPTATTMTLRLSSRGKAARPAEAIPLFTGGPFDPTYNATRPPVTVPIPADAKKVELYALITGHGAELYQCAEFCAHQHEFTVNGASHDRKYKDAGSSDACVEQIEHGMVPNQGGTWWFGRGGWCPGQQVEPWVIDVTGDVTPGQDATIAYRGLFADLDPFDKLGTIQLSSYLVISR